MYVLHLCSSILTAVCIHTVQWVYTIQYIVYSLKQCDSSKFTLFMIFLSIYCRLIRQILMQGLGPAVNHFSTPPPPSHPPPTLILRVKFFLTARQLACHYCYHVIPAGYEFAKLQFRQFFKGSVSRDFQPAFFHDSKPSRPLINRPKYFRFCRNFLF